MNILAVKVDVLRRFGPDVLILILDPKIGKWRVSFYHE